MATEATVVIDLSGMDKFARITASDLKGSGRGPYRKAFKQWGYRFRTEMTRRFAKFSRGGGDWPKLKRKRKRGSLSSAAILRDTNTLFQALTPGFIKAPGQLQEDIKFGIRVGYGGPARHKSGAGVSVADIAEFHQIGAGPLPIRKVVVGPSRSTLTAMANDMKKAMDELAKDTIDGPR